MTATQLEHIRVRLTQMVQRLGTESSRLREEALGEVSSDEPPPQPGEIGKPTAEQEIDIALLGNEAQLLADCNDALERIRRGTFGVCEQCGEDAAGAVQPGRDHEPGRRGIVADQRGQDRAAGDASGRELRRVQHGFQCAGGGGYRHGEQRSCRQ